MVINAVAAHHEEVDAESLYAVLASAADAISSSRVGARSETTEIYIKRLEKLYDQIKPCVGLDLLAYTSEEFEAIRERPFIRQALREGRVLYEA